MRREALPQPFQSERQSAAHPALRVQEPQHDALARRPRHGLQQALLRSVIELVQDVDRENRIGDEATDTMCQVLQPGCECQSGRGPVGLSEMPRVAVDSGDRIGQPGLQERGPQLAATAADIHDVAEMLPAGQGQHVAMHRVVPKFATNIAMGEPPAGAVVLCCVVERRLDFVG